MQQSLFEPAGTPTIIIGTRDNGNNKALQFIASNGHKTSHSKPEHRFDRVTRIIEKARIFNKCYKKQNDCYI